MLLLTGRAMPPDVGDETHADQQDHGHPEQHALRAEDRDDGGREVPADNPPENGAAADEAERALGLARRHDVVRERVDLRRHEHGQHADPDVNDDELRPRFAIHRRPAPQAKGGQGEEHQAADLQVAQAGALADADIDAGGDPDEDRNRDVDVRERVGAELVEKQRVAGRLAGHGAGRREKQVEEQGKRPLEFPAVERQRPLQDGKHGVRSLPAGLVVRDPGSGAGFRGQDATSNGSAVTMEAASAMTVAARQTRANTM